MPPKSLRHQLDGGVASRNDDLLSDDAFILQKLYPHPPGATGPASPSRRTDDEPIGRGRVRQAGAQAGDREDESPLPDRPHLSSRRQRASPLPSKEFPVEQLAGLLDPQ